MKKHLGRKMTTNQHATIKSQVRKNKRFFYIFPGMVACLIFFSSCDTTQPARAETPPTTINVEKLADSIFWAEGGYKTSHPYGILAYYKTTTPRQACINTINSARKRFVKQTKEKDFIHFLSLTYCPIGCENDNGTNRFWVRNVKYWLVKNE